MDECSENYVLVTWGKNIFIQKVVSAKSKTIENEVHVLLSPNVLFPVKCHVYLVWL